MKLTSLFGPLKRGPNHRFSNIEKLLLAIVAIAAAVFMILRPPLLMSASHAPKSLDVQHKAHATSVKAADLDAQPKGIDLSHYQSDVDWTKAKASGVAFAYFKATEGNTYVDKSYAPHSSGATKAGVLYGGYHFYRPNDDPITQAKHFLSVVTETDGNLAPVLDLEIAPNETEKPDYVSNVLRWLKHVETQTGCKPIVYASPSFWRAHLGHELASYGFWIAEYNAKPKPPKSAPPWLFWQYSQKGHVAGIKGMVDLDVAASPDALLNSVCSGDKS